MDKVDLSFLMEFGEGDTVFVAELIEHFLHTSKKRMDTVSSLLATIQKEETDAQIKEYWHKIHLEIHSVKPLYGYFGMTAAAELAREIIKDIKSNELAAQLHQKLARIVKLTLDTHPFLEEELQNLSSKK